MIFVSVPLMIICLIAILLGLVKPSLVVRWGSKRTRGRVVLVYGLGFIAFAVLTVAFAPQEDQVEVVMPDHSILDEEVYDAPLKTEVTLQVLVSGVITEDGLRAMLSDLYSSTMARTGFEYHENPTNVYIFAFTSREQAESQMGLWIAMLEKAKGDNRPKISINESQMAHLHDKPGERFGLSEAQRQQIWRELIHAERRASAEASAKFSPQDFKQIAKLQNELNEKYKKEVIDKYGLTKGQAVDISVEGLEKSWPYPE